MILPLANLYAVGINSLTQMQTIMPHTIPKRMPSETGSIPSPIANHAMSPPTGSAQAEMAHHMIPRQRDPVAK